MTTTCTKEDVRSQVIDYLTYLYKKELSNKQPFKAKAYKNVLEQVIASHVPIHCISDMDSFKGIGKSIKDKLDVFIKEGAVLRDKLPYEDLLKVHGIGMSKAQELYTQHGISTLDQLRQKEHIELLNEKQKMGLSYVDDFQCRIPRKEMVKHEEFVKDAILSIDPGFVVQLTGSFRRQMSSSGDIDVLITHPDANLSISPIIDHLILQGYITDTFARGPKKCLAVCKLKRHKLSRRIDLLFTPIKEYPFALLYFTGSGEFNVKMRNHALSKGYSLSEHGLKHTVDNRDVEHDFKTEQDIFDFLGMTYVPPNER